MVQPNPLIRNYLLACFTHKGNALNKTNGFYSQQGLELKLAGFCHLPLFAAFILSQVSPHCSMFQIIGEQGKKASVFLKNENVRVFATGKGFFKAYMLHFCMWCGNFLLFSFLFLLLILHCSPQVLVLVECLLNHSLILIVLDCDYFMIIFK